MGETHPCGTDAAAKAGANRSMTRDERPCQGTANLVLGMLKTILEEKAREQGGRLLIDDVGKVIDHFMQAPGGLEPFYDDNYDRCAGVAVETARVEGGKEDFESKLRQLAAQSSGPFALGRLQMIGLQAVRKQLGGRWEELAERVQAIAEAVMRRRLSANDSFVRDAKGDVLVCFAGLSEEEAWLKAKSIEEEIRRRLLGEEPDGSLDGFELELETLCDVAEIDSHALGLSAPALGFEGGADLQSLVVEKLDQANDVARRSLEKALEGLGRSWKVEPLDIFVASNAAARFQLANPDSETRIALARLMPIARRDPALLVGIDLLALSAAAVSLGESRLRGGPLLAVTVHAASLADKSAFQRYAAACEALASPIRNRLILVLGDLPRDCSAGVLEDNLRSLRGFCRLQALRLRRPAVGDLDLEAAGLHLVFLNFELAQALARREPARYRRLIEAAKHAGARLLVEEVPDRAAGRKLFSEGIDMWALSPAAAERSAETWAQIASDSSRHDLG